MEFSNENNYTFSLHDFRLIFESNNNNLPEKDFIKKQKGLLKSSGINQSLSNKKCNEIRMKCKFMGEEGWAISPFWRPSGNETWYDTWFWMAYNNQSEKITDYFLENDYWLLKNINGYSRFKVDRKD